jgi:hypothetical protein
MCCLLVLLVTPFPNSSVSGQGQRRLRKSADFAFVHYLCPRHKENFLRVLITLGGGAPPICLMVLLMC